MPYGYDYWISVQEIDQPIGSNIKYVAKIDVFQNGKGKIAHDIGEAWGATEEDAREKMQVKIDEWLGHRSE